MTSVQLPPHNDLARALRAAGDVIITHGRPDGETALRDAWPFAASQRAERKASDREKLRVFKADGFRCRYTGELLLLPAYLRVLSALYPDAFPYQANWKAEETHPAYWSHTASLEHVEPIAVGGGEHFDNWVTTSMARNQVRSRFPLESLGWAVRPRVRDSDWDGGMTAFITLSAADDVLANPLHGSYIARWRKLAVEC